VFANSKMTTTTMGQRLWRKLFQMNEQEEHNLHIHYDHNVMYGGKPHSKRRWPFSSVWNLPKTSTTTTMTMMRMRGRRRGNGAGGVNLRTLMVILVLCIVVLNLWTAMLLNSHHTILNALLEDNDVVNQQLYALPGTSK